MDDKKVLFLGDSICRHYFEHSEKYLKNKNITAITPEKWVTVQWKQARTVDRWFAEKRRYSDLPGNCLCDAKFVHFNFGLHYIKLPNKGHDPDVQRATKEQIESFEEDLHTHIELIRSTRRCVQAEGALHRCRGTRMAGCQAEPCAARSLRRARARSRPSRARTRPLSRGAAAWGTRTRRRHPAIRR